ncbi:O-antigen ligase family protein [Massilia sp. S19_KUP03_FR1]|uniref:O-antigen ligase family protein n=1 Tax=Massilia sp. S19_KUP03_FR1 TaxID=3025503 RepID=UPI002FCCEB17
MADLLSWLFFFLPFMAVAAIAVLAVVGIGVGVVCPRVLAYLYMAIFFAFNSTSYGSLSLFATGGVYSRGSGLLLFPLVLWCVLGAWCCARASAAFAGQAPPACTLRPWFGGWLVLLVLHVGAALASGVKVAAALAPSGFTNIAWMAPPIFLLLLTFRTRAHAIELMRFIMLAGLARALFGLVRWAALGGDPNNVYANRNAIPIKLTFFDINDSLLCCLALTIAVLHLVRPGVGAAPSPRPATAWLALAWCTLLATSLCILLSYRRTAWIGLALAGLVIAWRFPWRRRLQLLALGLPPLALAIGVLLARRFAQSSQQGLNRLVYDMQSRQFGAESERVLELKLALADFLAHPLTGIGAWGRYAGFEHISWQANPDGGLFVHSGVLHIALKAGLPGLVLLAGLAWACMRASRAALAPDPTGVTGVTGDRHARGACLALASAGVAGLAFMLPDILVGTPVPQVRTTQMLAICMALPFIALQAGRTARQPGRGSDTAACRPAAPLPVAVPP